MPDSKKAGDASEWKTMDSGDESLPVADAREAESLPDELVAGSRAGDHVIGAVIARGGCGSVYSAEHRLLGRKAAVKVLHREMAQSPTSVKRFLREAMAVNRIRHPNIIDVFAFGMLPDGRPFYVMELLDGVTLSAVLRREGRFSPQRALEVLEPVCAALAAAHAAGIVHRDLKVSNVMVVPGVPPVVKLLDFGIAKLLRPEPGEEGLTAAGTVLGTPYAMAPEQIKGGEVDVRTDIYALGVMLYHLLTAEVPFDADTRIEMERQHLTQPAPRPGTRAPVPAALDAVVLRCLEKDKTRRYPSVEAFVKAFRDAVQGADVSPAEAKRAIGIYIEARSQAEMDDAMIDDVTSVIDTIERQLAGAHYQMPVRTSTAILGTMLLPEEPSAVHETARQAMDLAAAIHKSVVSRSTPDGRLHVNVCINIDGAVVQGEAQAREIVDGRIVAIDQWTPQENVPGICVTPQAATQLHAADPKRYITLAGPGRPA